MSKRMFTDEQIVKTLEEGERTEESKAEFCHRQEISASKPKGGTSPRSNGKYGPPLEHPLHPKIAYGSILRNRI